MDRQTKLTLALYQVDNIINLIEDNEYKQYMFMHLNPVYYELKRQLTNLTITDRIKKDLTINQTNGKNLENRTISDNRMGTN